MSRIPLKKRYSQVEELAPLVLKDVFPPSSTAHESDLHRQKKTARKNHASSSSSSDATNPPTAPRNSRRSEERLILAGLRIDSEQSVQEVLGKS